MLKMCYIVNNLDNILYLCTYVSANRHNMTLTKFRLSLSGGAGMTLVVDKAFAVYSKCSRNLAVDRTHREWIESGRSCIGVDVLLRPRNVGSAKYLRT